MFVDLLFAVHSFAYCFASAVIFAVNFLFPFSIFRSSLSLWFQSFFAASLVTCHHFALPHPWWRCSVPAVWNKLCTLHTLQIPMKAIWLVSLFPFKKKKSFICCSSAACSESMSEGIVYCVYSLSTRSYNRLFCYSVILLLSSQTTKNRKQLKSEEKINKYCCLLKNHCTKSEKTTLCTDLMVLCQWNTLCKIHSILRSHLSGVPLIILL